MSQALKNLLTLLNLEKIEEGLFRGQTLACCGSFVTGELYESGAKKFTDIVKSGKN